LANQAIWYAPANLGWDLAATVAGSPVPTTVCDSLEAIIAKVKADAVPGTQVVVMSNGGFGGLHGKLAEALS
ncbi:MAG: UDP-N-acetylmuramate:L-alanyl-gamma-D-glutamyl-meso-diaminopimelate ligase, partial [Gammaproteobacteria bacterium]|nr:UDP-N-acetylmuramate:L-alanyl-gamma-D-glutamyl-meso-diaminopimelate ligase [Gammaproteobacteria bacterium]